MFHESWANTLFFLKRTLQNFRAGRGEHPISRRAFSGNKSFMRQKTGNGHTVNLDTFLEDIKIVVRDGQELLKAGAGEVKEKAIYGARTTDRAIRKSPYQTIGIVLGVGIILGLLASGVFSGGAETEDVEQPRH
jgi:ElaB/YqjD/DUF883 family membrane-anchored ribosome-binding protein